MSSLPAPGVVGTIVPPTVTNRTTSATIAKWSPAAGRADYLPADRQTGHSGGHERIVLHPDPGPFVAAKVQPFGPL
jgi:hypothetical protein